MDNTSNSKNKQTAKTRESSRTTQIQIVMPHHTNPGGRLFGGVLIQWVDIVASVVARRHSGCEVATACIDSVKFDVSASLGSTLVIEGFITNVGTTSMEVQVNSYVESYDSVRRATIRDKVNSAFLVMVAVDEKGKPMAVPRLITTTEAEELDQQAAIKRAEYRKKHRDDN